MGIRVEFVESVGSSRPPSNILAFAAYIHGNDC